MSTTPRIALVAWEERQGDMIFVAVPNERGRYVRTDRSVSLVACPFCRAAIGEPCKRGRQFDTYGAGTHSDRRNLMKRHHGERGHDVVVEEPEDLTFPPIAFPEAA